MASRSRTSMSVRDMVLSLGLVLLVLAAVLLLGPARSIAFGHRGQDPVRVVDPAPAVRGARAAASWPVYAPEPAPAGWRCTSARVLTGDAGTGLHLGYVTAATTYAGLDQSDRSAQAFLDDLLGKGLTATGTVDVRGVTWQVERARSGDQALVRPAGRATVVVSGNASPADLQALAESLRPG